MIFAAIKLQMKSERQWKSFAAPHLSLFDPKPKVEIRSFSTNYFGLSVFFVQTVNDWSEVAAATNTPPNRCPLFFEGLNIVFNTLQQIFSIQKFFVLHILRMSITLILSRFIMFQNFSTAKELIIPALVEFSLKGCSSTLRCSFHADSHWVFELSNVWAEQCLRTIVQWYPYVNALLWIRWQYFLLKKIFFWLKKSAEKIFFLLAHSVTTLEFVNDRFWVHQ